ncbi:MAG: enoyl-CoA hydratase-related protein [Desulfobacterales bacterium]|jgi:enoyl-CoA hydratase/carnithine racemase|nr:enoyl-CoA hydratase-related protein [Desulfobacterales bacterium]MDD3081194.1 enoyl-CoA hydratase-related protein [Desulfobacterales bacterium]MDD3950258.1 enoyl-CoA hydratase-related protein [Desulfobacterales bacterium]MDY0378233.1 enoyl-CoA hydratase-related protein [Desulfobacterales bacterium]
MSNQEILVEKQQYIGIITLNRPDAFNTFNVPFARQLNDSLVALDNDDDIRVIVVRANGPQFSIGISLDEFKGKCHKEFREFLKGMDEHNHTISKMKKPVIASVKGLAIANGAGLVFACDMAVASEKAKFGTTAINVGLICLGPAAPLMRQVGRKKTLEMVLTGEMIPASEALRLGLVNKVVPEDQLEAATMELAGKLAAKSPLALQIGKTGIYAMDDLPYHRGLDYLTDLFASLCDTEDVQEGLAAFQGKRSPEWKLK